MLLQLFQISNNEIYTLTLTCNLSFFLNFYFYYILLYNTVLVLPYIDMNPPNLFLKLNMLTVRKGRKYLEMFSFPPAWILIFLYFNMEIKWKKFTWVIAVNISLALNLRIKEKNLLCQRHSQKTNSNSTQGYINSKLCFHSGSLLLLFSCLERAILTDSCVLLEGSLCIQKDENVSVHMKWYMCVSVHAYTHCSSFNYISGSLTSACFTVIWGLVKAQLALTQHPSGFRIHRLELRFENLLF